MAMFTFASATETTVILFLRRLNYFCMIIVYRDGELLSVFTTIFILNIRKLLLQILEKDTIHTFDRPISGQQEAEIFDPVDVIPDIVLFPWYPVAQKNVAEYKQFQYLLEVKFKDKW